MTQCSLLNQLDLDRHVSLWTRTEELLRREQLFTHWHGDECRLLIGSDKLLYNKFFCPKLTDT